jgi:hypothetical protein
MAPGWGESFILVLARETGWTLDYIQRRAPLALLIRIYHSVIWGNGAWTVRQAPRNLEAMFAPPTISEDEDDE